MRKYKTTIKTDPNNRLVIYDPPAEVFDLKEINARAKLNLSHSRQKALAVSKLALEGTWSLNNKNNLVFRVSGNDRTKLKGKTFTFQGKIESRAGNELVFYIRNYRSKLGTINSTIRLTGKWGSDRSNRLIFYVARRKDRYDSLIFNAKWSISKRNEIVCNYTETQQKTKVKKTAQIVIKGRWDINKGQLIYRVENQPGAYIGFKVSFKGTKKNDPGKNLSVGVDITLNTRSSKKKYNCRYTLYGTWKLTRDLKCYFELFHPTKRKQRIDFAIEKLVGDTAKLTVYLKRDDPKDPEFKIEFNSIYKDDVEMFTAVSARSKSIAIVGGITAKF